MSNPTLDTLLQAADSALEETTELLAALVRIPSINTGPGQQGNETDVCLHLARKLRKDGIEPVLLEAQPGRGNLIASLGGNAGPKLMLMSHTDTVPVEEGTLWQHPPFSGIIADGKVHGRGAADCKALTAASTMALLILARSGLHLHGELILAATADEESGGQQGFGWLANTHPELVTADYALNEGGGSPFFLDDTAGYILNTGEKGRLEAMITLRGKGGHAAVPWTATNPIETLPEVIRRIVEHQPIPDLSHPSFSATSNLLQFDPVRFIQRDFEEIAKASRALASTLRGAARMTITPTVVRAGAKANAIPSSCHVVCDVRTLPGQTAADVERHLETILAGVDHVETSVSTTAEPSASPYPTPFSEQVQRATSAAVGRNDLLWLPGLTAGFTDSRFARRLGATVYGFSPQALDPERGTPEGIHGQDEYMPIESLQVTLRTLVAVAWEVLVAHP